MSERGMTARQTKHVHGAVSVHEIAARCSPVDHLRALPPHNSFFAAADEQSELMALNCSTAVSA